MSALTASFILSDDSSTGQLNMCSESHRQFWRAWYVLLNSDEFSKLSMHPSFSVYPSGHGFGGSQYAGRTPLAPPGGVPLAAALLFLLALPLDNCCCCWACF